MQNAIRVFAGDCAIRYRSDDAVREQRGAVLVLAKPDNTVLVHDAEGYQPAAWLTRADAVRVARDADGFRLVAGKGDQRLRVTCEKPFGDAHYHASVAGEPVGECPDCGAALVRDGGRVACVDCLASYSVPRDATVLDDACPDCGLPRMRLVRGEPIEVCVDYDCDPLAEAVDERFGGAWACPDCGEPTSIERGRGLRATCGACGRSLRLPAGRIGGGCDCGLPRFETPDGDERCLDPDCDTP